MMANIFLRLFAVLVGVVVAGRSVAQVKQIPTVYETPIRSETSGLDSPAIWVAEDPANSILFTSAKKSHNLEMEDPTDGTYMGVFGSSGSNPGEFNRPNGVAVAYNFIFSGESIDLLLVTERDNNRVSVFKLPDLNCLLTFGDNIMDQPMGIAVNWYQGDLYVYVTSPGHSDRPVYIYKLYDNGGTLAASLETSFSVSPAGEESIVVDGYLQRVLVADEQGEVYVYTLFGESLIAKFGQGYFGGDVEGIVIYDCGLDSGYVIISDQQRPTEFEVFSRKSYHHIGTFTGKGNHVPEDTDGLAITQATLPNLPNGAFWSQNNDRSVFCFDWKAIADSFGLMVVTEDDQSLPVELSSFSARVEKDVVFLTWTVESEIENAGFELYRKTDRETDFSLIQSYQTHPALKGKGTSSSPTSYHTVDMISGNAGESIRYRLAQVDYSGERHILRTITVRVNQQTGDEHSSNISDRYFLFPNYPNPFNPTTTLPVRLARDGKIHLAVYDVSGKEVKVLFHGFRTAGVHAFTWDGTDATGNPMPSGIYFAQLLTQNLRFTRKMLLVR